MTQRYLIDLVLRAIRAARPRTRYVAGTYARPLIFLRWLLPDLVFDRIIMRLAG